MDKRNFSRVEPMTIRRVSQVSVESDVTEYDLMVATLGFESRSSFASSRIGPRARKKVAFGFEERKVLSYEANKRTLEKSGFKISETSESEFSAGLASVFASAERQPGGGGAVCIDVSSMTRSRMAAVVWELAVSDSQWTADFVYSVAKFSPPTSDGAPIESCGPVRPEYAGWSPDPMLPVSAVVGLGYEYHRALGVVELLEPAVRWAFMPFGESADYDRALEEANEQFIGDLKAEQIVRYQVDQPLDCFRSLESVVFGALRGSRPVLVPFGPKIFTLVCLLITALHAPNVALWRVSSGQREEPEERYANGKLIGLRVEFGARSAEGASSHGHHQGILEEGT